MLLCLVLAFSFLGCARGCAKQVAAPPDAGTEVATGPSVPARPAISEEELAGLPYALSFVSERSGIAQVHLYDLQSRTDVALTKGPRAHFPAGLSPDGKNLLVIETEG